MTVRSTRRANEPNGRARNRARNRRRMQRLAPALHQTDCESQRARAGREHFELDASPFGFCPRAPALRPAAMAGRPPPSSDEGAGRVPPRRPSSASARGGGGVFLSPDERYGVWVVKAAERPELLLPERAPPTDAPSPGGDRPAAAERSPSLLNDDETKPSAGDDREERRRASHEALPLPLTDGCDLEGWRRHGLVVRRTAGEAPGPDDRDEVLAVLNVGAGCALLRRERQIPTVGRRMLRPWLDLRRQAMHLPHPPQARSPPRLQYTPELPLHPWFERDNVPAILEGCADRWPANETCRWERLVERFGHLEWRFSDAHGETLTLSTYCKYVTNPEGQTDDAPLAVYDSQFHLDERRQILDEYEVPRCFDTDLFELLDERDESRCDCCDDCACDCDCKGDEDGDVDRAASLRPPYRWILIGPPRSGTGLHIDPVGTHAWVTLLQGLKRWVLFPPDTDPGAIGLQSPQIPSAVWFRDYYPRVVPNHPRAVHVLQRPGETVFVPAGWPHLVLNLDLSVALTHNFATEYPSMERLWTALQSAEPGAAEAFARGLRRRHPDLHAQLPPSRSGAPAPALGGSRA